MVRAPSPYPPPQKATSPRTRSGVRYKHSWFSVEVSRFMSIIVFYLRNISPAEGMAAAAPQWQPECLAYSDAQMGEALKQCQLLRADPLHMHVTISSELRDMVGPVGVAAVENGHTPDGEVYEWSKAGRAGASRKNAQQPPVQRKDMDT